MTPDEIIREISRRAWSFGVAVILSPADHVMCDGLRASGYFDGESSPPLLAVATGLPADRWLGVLLHEYSHLTQWAEAAPVWALDTGAWDEWIAGKSIPGVKKKLIAAREVEADCERRTLRLIKELQAPVDVDRYARCANAYVHFYNTIAATRQWYAKDCAPYNIPEVLAACNPTLDQDFSKTPKALAAVLLKHCIEPNKPKRKPRQ